MATRTRQAERREDALSRERIVDTAVELLDATGEDGLTFRALAARLETGAGAIYWHVANKDELLLAATDAVLTSTMSVEATGATPEDTIRAVALGVFDAIDLHPWVGTRFSRNPSQPAMLRIFERIGRQVQVLGVPPAAQFTAASTVLNFIFGVGGQNAANARERAGTTNRADHLNTVSAAWAKLDPVEYSFTRHVAEQLRKHDDRVEFLNGINLILTGISGLRRAPTGAARTSR